MLHDWRLMLSKDLIVGAVHKLLLVWVMIDSALAVPVVDRQTVDTMRTQHIYGSLVSSSLLGFLSMVESVFSMTIDVRNRLFIGVLVVTKWW